MLASCRSEELTLPNAGSLDPEIIRFEQERNLFCKELHPGRFNSKNEVFMTQPG
jgi:hypothetical protein